MSKKEIDPRLQFIVLFITGIVVLFSSLNQLILINVIGVLYLILNRRYKRAIHTSVFLGLIILLHFYALKSGNQIIKFFGFFTFLALRFSPIMTYTSVLQDVPSGKLMAFLQKIGIPKSLLITLAIVLRFFPLLKLEQETIQLSAKLRGLSISQPKNWLHPLSAFEYSFVPLMMRTMRISDELSASAMTKGIDYPEKRTSIYDIKLSLSEILILIAIIFAYGLILVFGGQL